MAYCWLGHDERVMYSYSLQLLYLFLYGEKRKVITASSYLIYLII